jgi:hypothetical protein
MKTSSYITIFHREHEWYNSFSVALLLPTINIGNISDTSFYEAIDGVEVEFPTKIRIAKTIDYWSVSFQILGFGMSMIRQWGY